MIRKLFCITCMALFFMGFSIPDRTQKKANKVIEKFYDIEHFSKKIVDIAASGNEETIAEFGEGNLFKIEVDETVLGYGYIGNAPSKTATFDYLVLFDINFTVTKSKVLIYREEYGGEIGSKRWLKQFNGKSSTSEEMIYNQNIIPISGATISVRSMTKAMNELLQSIGKLQELNLI